MAFIRAKRHGAKRYHELVETHRISSKVRQWMVAYLGEHPTIEAAYAALPARIVHYRTQAARHRSEMERLRSEMPPAWLGRNGGEVPRPRRGGSRYANKLFGQYWWRRQFAEVRERWADALDARLAKIREVCSAHNSLAAATNVGTTTGSVMTGAAIGERA